MFGRSFAIVLLFLACSLPAWSQCRNGRFDSNAVYLPRVVQARAVHLISEYPIAGERGIGHAVVGLCFPKNDATSDFGEIVRDQFQRRGFFKVRLTNLRLESILESTHPPSAIFTAFVELGDRYRLKDITFTGNKTLKNSAALRNLFPIKDGSWFNTEAARQGLKRLKEAYGQYGFINFTPVPDFTFDEYNKSITMRVDINEGAQYFIASFDVRGTNPKREAALKSVWNGMFTPPVLYNSRAIKVYFERARNLLPPGATPDRNLEIKQDNQKHTVNLVLNAAP